MKTLRIHEIYASLQGESTFAGLPCVFVRTTGCPLRCTYCDTTQAFFDGEDLPLDRIVERVLAFGLPLVEITGGEPLIQKNVLPLISTLCDLGQQVLLETSGAFEISQVDPRTRIIMDIKCPDSGEHERNLWQNLQSLKAIDEIKFVLASRRDYEFARQKITERKLADQHHVLLSVVFAGLAAKDVAAWMLEDKLNVRFQLQLHKFIWDSDARGV